MITSQSNDRVKHVRALQARRNARQKASQFVIEGLRLVTEARLAGMLIDEVFYTETFAQNEEALELLDGLSGLNATLMAVDDAVMQSISNTHTPQGVVAVLPDFSLPVADDFSFALIVDAVSDPGNMGTLIRSAAAAGVDMLITTSGTVDVMNPKVLRSAMGAHFRLPIRHWSWEGVASRLEPRAIFLSNVGSGAPYFDVDLTQPCAVIVSGEAHGPSEDALRVAHAHLTVPMPGAMESLNVAMAASVVLLDRVRQLRNLD